MPASTTPDPLQSLGDAELLARLPLAAALPDAPAHWQQRALAAWRAPAAVRTGGVPWAEAVQALRERVMAVLSFDSWATAPLAAGLRSTGSTTRQLVFSADGRDVDLRITPQGGRFAVSGQVLGPDDRGTASIAALPAAGGEPAGEQAHEIAQEVALDEFGEFRMAELEAGRYQLTLRLSQHELVLPAFDVGDSGPARPGDAPRDGRGHAG
ncbi:hypothetical protein AACH06_07770 [Ideonella sp. DXS29W]|uniref:Carboxypeptidase regulatory-like domain-containing protein n=1 Tax=Ideonella lacteola TaxID=2984193 RepID=A0ABU9BP80_9BURK